MKKMTIRQIADRNMEINHRFAEMVETCDRENRERNEAEETEYRELCREQSMLQMRMSEAISARMNALAGTAPEQNADQILRESLNARRPVTIMLTREIQTTAALKPDGVDTGIIPIYQQEILKPLRAGLIYDKVGINIRTGLNGTLRWPMHGKAVAQWADETARLTDTAIDFSSLEMQGERLGVAIPVSKTELEDSHGIVEGVIREEMPKAIADKINEALFTTVGTYQEGGNTKTKKVVGPLVHAMTNNCINFAGEVPTRKELLKMKARVAGAGINMIAPCWVMTENMKAELEDLKVDAGSGRFVCENDKIFGYPVFTTDKIEEGVVAFGDWSYQASGFFGPMDLTVDPYTMARQWSTDFVLNCRFGTTTLRHEAFVVGKKPAQANR